MTALDPLLGLDFEVAPPRCVGKACERPATWALTILCPLRHGSIMCGPHHDAWVRVAAAHLSRRAVCHDCPGPNHPELPVPFYLWRSLL